METAHAAGKAISAAKKSIATRRSAQKTNHSAPRRPASPSADGPALPSPSCNAAGSTKGESHSKVALRSLPVRSFGVGQPLANSSSDWLFALRAEANYSPISQALLVQMQGANKLGCGNKM